MTMHRAKGLEFSKVILAGHGAWPGYFKGLMKNWDPSMVDEADLRERSLIYVAMTRARDELVVISR
jgi:superfamily I DNA/RNA helicase